jgi:hypothetical protein
MGYDENSLWIRSQDLNGAWYDGELVNITLGGATTLHQFVSVTSVQKPVTNGTVRVWNGLTLVAMYEPDETRPWYRRSLVTGLADTTTEPSTVEVLAKLRFIPVAVDTDWLSIGNGPAIKFMVMAILKEERNLPQEAAYFEAKALDELHAELKTHEGAGRVSTLRVEHGNTFGASGLMPVQ